jgi:hypothetical protein
MKPVKLIAGAAIVLAAIQLIPYGRDHKNPPVSGEPKWDSPRTSELFGRACKNCHSNETIWPWYSSIGENEGDKAAGEVREGKMPPFFYLPAHPEAKLSAAEKAELTKGLVATFGEDKPGGEKDHEKSAQKGAVKAKDGDNDKD